ncbi:MAG TPA: glycosyltransferase family 2 protein [Spirochaetota bacterium]|nr:glycosyltransferase family 2 protein [Spirochaetota bacterium]HOM39131.1 glycosyltransferase family 2 protein [Spirochaetota bacterium]HPQ50014.1 glycosyltransferase family 2 protein [Spirochaetota bacterium]
MNNIISYLYLLTTVVLFLYGLHFYVLVFLYKRNYKRIKYTNSNNIPYVTVQLPIYNEANVVERLITASVNLKYPKDKLEIQVLDDSTDETRDIAKELCERFSKKGYNIKYIRRENRQGYKAGALKYGLDRAEGEFIAIFDSDFIPNPDFLEKTLPFLISDAKVALVQTRWDFYNRDYSLLTRIQATALDGHFIVEQKARSDSDLWFNFNGTAGIWRKEAIIDAGNWETDTLTEDLDLSYRAQIKGWKNIYLAQLGNESELPITMNAYKSQQFRWAKGAFQCLRKLLPKIVKAKAPLKSKLEALVHLINYSAYIFLFINFLLMFPLSYFANLYNYNPWDIVPIYFSVLFFVVGILGPLTYFYISQKKRGLKSLYIIVNLIGLIILNFGLTITIIKAFFEVYFLNKKSEFVRTPKYSGNTKKIYKTSKFLIQSIIEIIIGLWAIYVAYYTLIGGMKHLPGISFFAFIYSIGFLWVGLTSLKEELGKISIKKVEFNIQKNSIN